MIVRCRTKDQFVKIRKLLLSGQKEDGIGRKRYKDKTCVEMYGQMEFDTIDNYKGIEVKEFEEVESLLNKEI